MRPLYEIKKDIADLIDMETGEILDIDKLDALNLEVKEKNHGVALGIKNLEAEAEMVKAEAKKFNDRARAIQNRIDGLKTWMQNALEGQEFDDGAVKIRYRTTKACLITDMGKVPNEWLKEQEPIYRKVDMLKAMKDGETIPGAEIEERQSLNIKYLM